MPDWYIQADIIKEYIVLQCEEKFSSVNFYLSYSNIKSIVLYAEVQHKKLDFRYVLYSVDTLDCI